MRRVILVTMIVASMVALPALARPPMGPGSDSGRPMSGGRGPGMGPGMGYGPGSPGGCMMSGSPMGMGPGRMLPVLLHNADLTPDQRTKVRDIMRSHGATFRKVFGELRTAHEALGEKMFAAGPLSEADLREQLGKTSELRQKLTEEGAKVMLEVRAVLTPEQLAKMDNTRKRLDELRKEMAELLGEPGRPDFK
jgi:Spy/CpxP family protein refolding chaperone